MPSYRLKNISAVGAGPLPLRCPICGNAGTFEPVGDNIHDVHFTNERGQVMYLGQRRCPNRQCRGHVFVAYNSATSEVEASYPPLRTDFDATDIPKPVTTAFEEALTCHATGCYVAAGMMVRKTLEALCADRGVKGDDLKARLTGLRGKVVLPEELLAALQDLRLLGNDAAHIESKAYEQVGKAEVDAAIAVTKEVLKAVYQYAALVKQLQALKKPSS
jgi:hypothetical protein